MTCAGLLCPCALQAESYTPDAEQKTLLKEASNSVKRNGFYLRKAMVIRPHCLPHLAIWVLASLLPAYLRAPKAWAYPCKHCAAPAAPSSSWLGALLCPAQCFREFAAPAPCQPAAPVEHPRRHLSSFCPWRNHH